MLSFVLSVMSRCKIFYTVVMLASATFGRFTIKYALKMIATSGFLTAFQCTKFVFGRGFAPDATGGAYSAPQTPSWFKGDPTSKGKGR